MGVMDLRRNILLNEPHIATETGNPIAFNTDVKGLLGECKVAFEPVQEGSGDPSPSNVRPITGTSAVNVEQTGKNLACVSSYVREQDRSSNGITYHAVSKSMVHVKGLASANSYMIPSGQSADTKLKAGKYTISSNLPNENGSRVYITSATESISYHAVYSGHPVTKTITKDLDDVQVQIYIGSGTDIDMDVWVQIELGESASTYAEYTGQSYPVTFPAVGKNLFDQQYTTGLIQYEGQHYWYTTQGTSAKSAIIQCEPNTTYTIKKHESSNRFYVGTTPQEPTNSMDVDFLFANNASTECTVTTNANAKYLIVYVSTGSEGATPQMQIEKGSTATAYEPYTNTVYGGSLDLVTGVLTVEWCGFTAKWKDGANAVDRGNNIRKQYTMPVTLVPASGTVTAYCNVAKWKWNFESDDVHFYANGNAAYVFLPEDTDGELDVHIVGKLATPQTYQLTPQQITALIGNNTIWSDTNGDVTIKFWKH